MVANKFYVIKKKKNYKEKLLNSMLLKKEENYKEKGLTQGLLKR